MENREKGKERKIIQYEVSWPSGPNPSYRMTFPPDQFKNRLAAGFVVHFRSSLMRQGGKIITVMSIIDLKDCDIYRVEGEVTVTKSKVDIPDVKELVENDIRDNDDTLLTD